MDYKVPSWYKNNKEEIEARKQELRQKIYESPDALYLPEVPVDRHRPRERKLPWVQRPEIVKKIKFKKE